LSGIADRPSDVTTAPCTYQLVIRVAKRVQITVGRLGVFVFPKGTYIYTGSARRNFEARIARHLREEKTLRWHIDYLLTAPGVSVVDVKRSTTDECELNQAVVGEIVIPGFGASDCRHGCGSHLKRL
jgi:Uri superfamily endonuclease